MSSSSVNNPYQPSANTGSMQSDGPISDSLRRNYRNRAVWYLVLAIPLLVISMGMLALTAGFVVWAIRAGNVPPIGIVMAAGMRGALSLVAGVPGLLMLWAARSAQRVATQAEPSLRQAEQSLRALWIGLALVCLGLVGLVVAFFVALVFSNM